MNHKRIERLYREENSPSVDAAGKAWPTRPHRRRLRPIAADQRSSLDFTEDCWPTAGSSAPPT